MIRKRLKRNRGYFLLIALIVIAFAILIFNFIIIMNKEKKETILLASPWEYDQLPNVLTYWGPNIDLLDQAQWNNYLNVFNQLEAMGFTHAGVHIWNADPISNATINDLIKSRISEIRNNGMKIAFHHSPGHKFLTNSLELDPSYHSSNGQNLKYFDSVGFNASICNLGIDCSENPERDALDPAYSGVIWQKELSLLDNLTRLVNISSSDIALFDTEIWGGVLGWKRWYYFYLNNPTGGVYPNLLMNSTIRYTGDRREREAQFFSYWKQRGLNLKNIIKQHSPQSFILFYGENIPDPGEQIPFDERECIDFRGYEIPSCLCSTIDENIACPIVSYDIVDKKDHNEITYMPIGTGDASSPSLYQMPNLTAFNVELERGNFTGTYVWISFSSTQTNPGFTTPIWDPILSQKIGKVLKDKGVKGVIVYPGPWDHNVPIYYFLSHAEALSKGFIDGIDPGELTEFCNDGMDNDGDVSIDESDCVDQICTDADSDGYCEMQGGEVAGAGILDCVDTNNLINPGAAEICDGVDNDCDFEIDEGCISTTNENGANNGGGQGQNNNSIVSRNNDTGSEWVCVERWNCSGFSRCENALQGRTCSDSNNCGTIASRPYLQQSCDVEIIIEGGEKNNKLIIVSVVVLTVFIVSLIVFLALKLNAWRRIEQFASPVWLMLLLRLIG